MGRGRSGHGDGLALQSVVVHGGVIAVGGVLHHGDHRAGVPLSDEVGHLLALQSGLQSQGLGGGLAALLDGQDVGVSGGAALDEQGVVHGVQAGVDGVVAVDHGVVQIGQHIGQLGGLCLHDLHIVRILHDVVLGGGDAHAVLQLDDAVLLQQQQGAGFVGGVVGNTDLDDGSVGLVAAVVGLAAARLRASTAARARVMILVKVLCFMFAVSFEMIKLGWLRFYLSTAARPERRYISKTKTAAGHH